MKQLTKAVGGLAVLIAAITGARRLYDSHLRNACKVNAKSTLDTLQLILFVPQHKEALTRRGYYDLERGLIYMVRDDGRGIGEIRVLDVTKKGQYGYFNGINIVRESSPEYQRLISSYIK